jgi:hypothetical protein
MNKNKLIFIVAGFMFVAGIGFAVHAAPPSSGDCPGGQPWEMVRVNKAIDRDDAEAADDNDDRWVCEKDEGAGEAQYQDNHLHEN